MKKWYKFKTMVEEIVNIDSRLSFILSESKFIYRNNSNFSDKGFIDQFRINDVVKIHKTVFHITDRDYYDFNDPELISRKAECKIELFNRILYKHYHGFILYLKQEIEKYFPRINFHYFFTQQYSYILFENSDEKSIMNIKQIMQQAVVYYPLSFKLITDFFLEGKYCIYFVCDQSMGHLLNISINDFPFFWFNSLKLYYGMIPELIFNLVYYDLVHPDNEFLFVLLKNNNQSQIVKSENLSHIFGYHKKDLSLEENIKQYSNIWNQLYKR